ncbi:MAG: protein kinase [Myxococcales bacterium]|nr:protein kinase [Myxococcales bacterium]
MPARDPDAPFAGTDRYEVVRRLGAGGHGVVYEAVDRDSGERVALKTLQSDHPEALYRLKREFRALADVRHHNLVRLHDLVADPQWFITMELVDGRDFLHALAGAPASQTATQAAPRAHAIDSLGRTLAVGPGSLAALADHAVVPVARHPRADVARLRPALRQLVDGVVALHRRGMLHRDLKPSNVLVTPAGRVVILDFGLVREQSLAERPDVAGTIEYMAPEQAAGREVTAACDWYSVGVMLFEALTGRLPYHGSVLEVIGQKLAVDAPELRGLAPDAPSDLAALCMALLARDPDERPGDDEVLALVAPARDADPRTLPGLFAPLAGPRPATPAPPGEGATLVDAGRLFVGREPELAALAEAAARAREGAASVALISGRAGLGKTSLLARFLAGAPGLVLAGRCHERERVPYKAVDEAVDDLARALRERDDPAVAGLCPPHVHTLARLFPVLRRVPAIDRAPHDAPDLAPHELRQAAFDALRELLARLARDAPVVLALDDFHWADGDSVTLLRDLLRPPDPPPILLVVAYRGDVHAPVVQALRAAVDHPELARRELELLPLEPAAARRLARGLLGAGGEHEADAVARQSEGNPLLLAELCHFVRGAGALAEAPSFEAVLRARLAGLAAPARALLAVVALATQPIDPELAVAVAAGREPIADPSPHLAALRREHLVRSHSADGATTLEVFHDRVRDVVLAGLDPLEQRAIHRALAARLEQAAEPDSDALTFHLEAAGEPARAAAHALRAAAGAGEALAFDRAAALYRRALLHAADAERPAILERLGEVLASDGRGGEAADAFEQAADAGEPGRALERLRRAGFERLRSGQIDAGLAVLRKVLAGEGMRLSPTRAGALVQLARHRVALTLRGLKVRERDEQDIAPQVLRRIDVAWSVGASGLGMVDDIAAGQYQSLSLRLALEAGEPRRICRALAGEVAFSAVGGTRSARRTAHLLHTARTLAERLGDPLARGTVAMTAGIACYLEGRFRDAADTSAAAELLLRGCPDAAWDLQNARLFGLHARVYLGEWDRVGHELAPLLRDAEARGSLYMLASLRAGPTHLHWLARGELDAAAAGIDEVARRWSTRGMQVQHYWQIHARCNLDIWRGDPRAALARLECRWPDLATLRSIQFVRIDTHHLRARCRLAAGDVKYLEPVLADARAIEAERAPWGVPLAQLLRAAVALRRDDRRAAVARLAEAAAAADPANMSLHAALARLRRADLSQGTAALMLREGATTWLESQGVRDIPRLLATLTPGLDPR